MSEKRRLEDATDEEIDACFEEAASNAVAKMLKAGISVHYMENGFDVVEYPNGRRYRYHLRDGNGEIVLDEEIPPKARS